MGVSPVYKITPNYQSNVHTITRETNELPQFQGNINSNGMRQIPRFSYFPNHTLIINKV
jgi:hypothetical protein